MASPSTKISTKFLRLQFVHSCYLNVCFLFQIETDKNEGNGDDEEILKFLNITGSVREWLQLEPMPTKPLLTKSESESVSGSPLAVECEDSNEPDMIHFQNRNSIFVSEWLPVERFRTDEFTAVAT